MSRIITRRQMIRSIMLSPVALLLPGFVQRALSTVVFFPKKSSDGYVGTSDNGALSAGLGNTLIYLSKFDATAGQVGYAHAYVKYLGASGNKIEIGLWESDGTFITSQTSSAYWANQNDVWINLALSSAVTLSATDYIVGAITDDTNWQLGNDNGTGSGYGAGTVSGTLGSLGDITPPTFSGNSYSIVFDNSSGDPS